MLPSLADILVVGGGKAGSQLTASLRDEGFEGTIAIVGEEPLHPYDRPPLSKEYLGMGDVGGLLLRAEHFYLDSAIDIETATRIVSFDTAKHVATRSDGSEITYGELVLATGARPRKLRIPGADSEGVSPLRSVEDADRLKAILTARSDLVVIGGGFVGLEVAATAAISYGCKVTVMEALPRLLSRTALPETAAHIQRFHEALGVDVLLGAQAAEILSDNGRVTAVVTTEGQVIPADGVVYGIGVEPRVELAEAAGIEVANGVLVDSTLHSSADGVWAIGDCCAFPSVHFGGSVRLESVQNATDQARHLAGELFSGVRSAYTAVPWFWSDQGELHLQSVGLTGTFDSTVVIGDADSGSFTVLAFHDGRLLGGDSVNAPGDHLALKRLLGSDSQAGLTATVAGGAGFTLKDFARQARLAKEALSRSA
ncbi:MAG: pyridine nucleotide-disulfide oxidoreductase family protein [Subtercola sp.]|nr:pyridine nucleotide-disulfide oxidoreductase family protein [Subtercola sp.]